MNEFYIVCGFGSIQSDGLISTLSKPTPAPTCQSCQWRRGPPSNKVCGVDFAACDLRVWSQDAEDTTINVRTCGIDGRRQERLQVTQSPAGARCKSPGFDPGSNTEREMEMCCTDVFVFVFSG